MGWYIRLQDQPRDKALRGAFERWRSADPRHAEAYARIDRMMAMPALATASRKDAARLAATVPRQRQWLKHVAAIAAVLLLAIGLWQYPALLIRFKADYLTAAGEQKRIALPDGSAMTLNTASAVALDFAGGRRNVRLLEGEAFFDVRPDPAHPFTVKGPFSEVVVTGTAFSVRAGDDEDIVVLARGRVTVGRLSAPQDHVELVPGQTVAASVTSLSKVADVETSSLLAWLEGRVIFHDEPFAEALAELRRYYGGPVLIAGSRFGDLKVSGSYRIDDPEAAIRTLAEAARAALTRLPGGVIILH